jgi:small neutral amino acid transporter SnatA (MarC family)
MAADVISPIFFVGLIVFVGAVILGIFGLRTPAWATTAGIVIVMVGIGHTVYLRSKK